jgi:hypothetical protein
VSGVGQNFFTRGQFKIRLGHHAGQLLEGYFGFPTELLFRLGGVAQQQINLGRAQVTRILFNVNLPIQFQYAEDLVEKHAH